MSWIRARDISQYQGLWKDTGEPIVMIKMSGGDAGMYYDTRAADNYKKAVAAKKAVGGYHFAGGTDPVKEADFFIRAMSPLAEGDVMALDWEVANPDPVGWCAKFVNRVHAVTSVWPLIYMNTSTFTAHNWSPVTKNCGLWIADYRFTPDQTVPTNHPYVMHQYTSSPYDKDAWFGTIAQFKKYGYHKPVLINDPVKGGANVPKVTPTPPKPPTTETTKPVTPTQPTVPEGVPPAPVVSPPLEPPAPAEGQDTPDPEKVELKEVNLSTFGFWTLLKALVKKLFRRTDGS